MINTVLVEDDLYIQKHFTERLNVDGEFRLVGTPLKPRSTAAATSDLY